MIQIELSLEDTIRNDEVLELYRANQWSSADKPEQLLAALRGSHSLVTARKSGSLVGFSQGHIGWPPGCLLSAFTCSSTLPAPGNEH